MIRHRDSPLAACVFLVRWNRAQGCRWLGIGPRRSQIRSWRAQFGAWRRQIGPRRSQIRSWRTQFRSRGCQIGPRRRQIRSWRTQFRSRGCQIGPRRHQVRSWWPQFRSWRCQVGPGWSRVGQGRARWRLQVWSGMRLRVFPLPPWLTCLPPWLFSPCGGDTLHRLVMSNGRKPFGMIARVRRRYDAGRGRPIRNRRMVVGTGDVGKQEKGACEARSHCAVYGIPHDRTRISHTIHCADSARDGGPCAVTHQAGTMGMSRRFAPKLRTG